MKRYLIALLIGLILGSFVVYPFYLNAKQDIKDLNTTYEQ